MTQTNGIPVTEIPVVSGVELNYQEAFTRFFEPNLPFIVTGLTSSWPAFREWVDEGRAKPNWALLQEHYGDSKVNVVDCREEETCPEVMLFSEVLKLWKEGKGEKLYIKDWHLRRQSKGEFYSVPEIFRDDWMDNYYSNKTDDDFAFVYFGTKGTFTPLHRDVYTSYSWSANVLGRKRWHFVAPEYIKYCRRFPEERTSQMVSDIRNVDRAIFNHFDKVKIMTVEQEQGSIIFVPSNWYHFVENLDDYVISINHNWCNSVNLPSMYKSMCDEVTDTENALEDVRELLYRHRPGVAEREWLEVVQDVLLKNTGWNWETLFNMITYNLTCPATKRNLRPSSSYLLSRLKPLLDDFPSRPEYKLPALETAWKAASMRSATIAPSS